MFSQLALHEWKKRLKKSVVSEQSLETVAIFKMFHPIKLMQIVSNGKNKKGKIHDSAFSVVLQMAEGAQLLHISGSGNEYELNFRHPDCSFTYQVNINGAEIHKSIVVDSCVCENAEKQM